MNDNKVIPLHGVTPQVTGPTVDPAVVEAIKDMLERAKRGEVRWIGFAWVDAVNIGHSVWEGGGDGMKGALLTSALGAVTFLDKRFGAACLDGEQEVPPPPRSKA